MIISIYIEKAFDKIQHQFMGGNNYPESRHGRNLPQHNKGHIYILYMTNPQLTAFSMVKN